MKTVKIFIVTLITWFGFGCSARHEAYRALHAYDQLEAQYPVSVAQPEAVMTQKIYTLGEALKVSLEAIQEDPTDARIYRIMYTSYYALDSLNVRDSEFAEVIYELTEHAFDRFTLAPEHKYFCYQYAKMFLARDKMNRMTYSEIVRCSQRQGVAGMMENEILEFTAIMKSLEYIYEPSKGGTNETQ